VGSRCGTYGRGRPVTAVAATKMAACRLMAMAGMTANHHRRVRHHTRATTTRQTPMTISVLPMWDQSAVTESQVRPWVSCSDRFRALSERFYPISGPVSSWPIAAMATHNRMPGASAPIRLPRTAVPRAGPVRRSRSGGMSNTSGRPPQLATALGCPLSRQSKLSRPRAGARRRIDIAKGESVGSWARRRECRKPG
jgi:hypothetical protein